MAEQLSPPGTEIVSPYMTRRGRYVPKVGDKITLDLPGEKTRAEIKGVVTPDIVLVELLSVPLSRAASVEFKKGDLVQARRSLGDHDIETWQVITERELQQQEARNRLAEEERLREEQAAKDRVAEIRKRDLAAQAAQGKPKRVRRAKGAAA